MQTYLCVKDWVSWSIDVRALYDSSWQACTGKVVGNTITLSETAQILTDTDPDDSPGVSVITQFDR